MEDAAALLERQFLPLLEHLDSLLSQFQDLSLNDLYVQLRVIDRMENFLKERMEDAVDWAGDEFWDKHLEKLHSFHKTLEDSRRSIRNRIAYSSRPHLRSLNILDMPDEILIKICEQLRTSLWRSTAYCTGTDLSDPSDIQNIRLTCWRLCNTSSHLLLRQIAVDFSDESSLLHLQTVSSHPTISKGITFVVVNLDFYDSVLAADFTSFIECNWNQLMWDRADWAHRLDRAEAAGKSEVGNCPTDVIRDRLEHADSIIKSWNVESWAPPVLRESKKHQRMLRRGYREYKRRFSIQQRLRESGDWVETVGTAMAKMPRAKNVLFRDDNFQAKARVGIAGFIESSDEAMDKAISKNMLVPFSGFKKSEMGGYGPAPFEILVKSILAMHQAGVTLTNIDIDITPPADLSTLAPSEEDQPALTAALQRLKHLTLRLNSASEETSSREPRALEDLQRFVGALLDTENLEVLWLEIGEFLNEFESQEHIPSSMGSILELRPRRKLSTLFWDGIPLHAVELERFLKRLDSKMMHLHLRQVRLLSGTWADVLDILHNESTKANIEDPTGAECDAMSEDEKRKMFGHYSVGRGKAYWYMKGLPGFSNPLREPPEEDSESSEEWSETEHSVADGEMPETQESDHEDQDGDVLMDD